MVHVSLLVLREPFDEPMESITGLLLATLTEIVADAALQDFIHKVWLPEGSLFLGVLAEDAHDLTETVGVVDCHFDSGQWLSLLKHQVVM